MDTITIQTNIILVIAGFFAGLIDSIAGGGGLIALPALLSVGLPAHLALGTNKLQGSFGTLTASLNYSRNNLVNFKDTIQGVIWTTIGAIIGTLLIQSLSTPFLNNFIPILLLAIFLYTLFSPRLGKKDHSSRLSHSMFYCLTGLILGFYDGFFGPGTGSFWMLSFVLFMGIDFTKATAHTKIMNFTSNIVALVVFILGGNVVFLAGIVMGLGQVLGAVTGSNIVILRGVKFVRIAFLVIIGVTIVKLMISTYF